MSSTKFSFSFSLSDNSNFFIPHDISITKSHLIFSSETSLMIQLQGPIVAAWKLFENHPQNLVSLRESWMSKYPERKLEAGELEKYVLSLYFLGALALNVNNVPCTKEEFILEVLSGKVE